KLSGDEVEVAEKQELFGLFDQLEGALDAVNFWRVAEKKTAMWQTIRHMFTRMQPTSQEVRTLRGMIRSLTER
ncbi:MAG: hypothetical protein MRY32_00335, partial [Rickettsiales bacterium]|nr:hypothetical protein [Rickettsiales bacterium]